MSSHIKVALRKVPSQVLKYGQKHKSESIHSAISSTLTQKETVSHTMLHTLSRCIECQKSYLNVMEVKSITSAILI